jgi:hypothetical protein
MKRPDLYFRLLIWLAALAVGCASVFLKYALWSRDQMAHEMVKWKPHGNRYHARMFALNLGLSTSPGAPLGCPMLPSPYAMFAHL